MDDKLPASNADFSKLQGKSGILRWSGTASPFNRFTPVTPGTFTILGKDGKPLPEKIQEAVIKGNPAVPKVGMELSPRSVKKTENQEESERIAEDAEIFREAGFSIARNPDGSVRSIEIPEDILDSLIAKEEKPKEGAVSLERLAFVHHLGRLEERFGLLQPKMNKISDHQEKTRIHDLILAAFQTLSWLKTSPNESTPNETIQADLDMLVKYLDQFEELITKAEEEEEALHVTPEKIKNLSDKFINLQDAVDVLKGKLGSNFVLPIFHADFIERQIQTLTELQKNLEKEQSDYNFGVFHSALEILEKLIIKAQEQASDFIIEETEKEWAAEDANKIAEDYLQKEQTVLKEALDAKQKERQAPHLVFDIWSAWPKTLAPNKAGVWYLNGEKLDDGDTWARIKVNFDQEMSVYLAFFKSGAVGEQPKKIEKYKDLIQAKNEILDALLEKKPDVAFALIGVFRERIVAAQEDWRVYTEKEQEEQKKKAAQEAEMKAQETSFKEINKEYQEATALKNSLFDLIGSNAERLIIEDLIKELEKQQNEIRTKLTNKEAAKELIGEYGKDVARLKAILAGSKNHIRAMYGGEVDSNLIFAPKKEDAKVYRIGKSTVTVKEWREEQNGRMGFVRGIEDTRRVQDQEKLINVHRESFKRSKAKFKELYLNKVWEKEDPNREAVEVVFIEYIKKLKEEISTEKLNIADLEEKLNQGDDELDTTEKVTLPIKLDIAKENLRNLENELLEFSSERGVLGRDPSDGDKIGRTYKAVYSPAQDASVFDIGKDRSKLNFEGKMDFDLAQRKRLKNEKELVASEKGMSDGEIAQKRDSQQVLLNDMSKPNHYDGMVRSVTKDDIEYEGIKHATPVISHASPEIPQETLPEQNEQNEQLVKKLKAVDTLIKTRLKNLLTTEGKKPWQQFIFGVIAATAIASGGGLALSLRKPEESPLGRPGAPTTIGEAVSWRDFFENNILQKKYNRFEMKQFIDSLVDPKINFYSFIQLYSPKTHIEKTNAATLAKMAEMNVNELLNGAPGVYGISDEERKDLCDIIHALGQIIIASQPNVVITSQSGKTILGSVDGHVYIPNDAETLLSIFDRVKNTATTADSKEKKV